MKRLLLVGAVVGTHVVVLGSIFMQGCGTTGGVTAQPTSPPPPAMPTPVYEPAPTRPVPTPAPLPVVRPVSADTKAYKVQKGDSLSLIAQRYGVSQAEILGLNALKDPNRLLLGQTLQLPGRVNLDAPRPTTTKAPAAAAAASAAPGAGEYVVQSGDSLSKISAKYKVPVADLRSANNLQGDRILVGQKLKIPGASVPAPAASAAPAVPSTTSATVAPAPAVTVAPVAAPAAETGGSYRTYEVAQGEDLYHISLMWDVELSDLQRVNNLTGTTLTPGQKLKIPLAE